MFWMDLRGYENMVSTADLFCVYPERCYRQVSFIAERSSGQSALDYHLHHNRILPVNSNHVVRIL
jgi:hypothetical protein